ncbi:translation initiation factor IF-2 [Alphaproteobacteria bacterium endosymbiont of Tiliacea citrago]|uniref:translation initiation factor IF-2 n=1 Tax=Alphaproteobacteria bacterium endosymbiont of Tiliacea citrago TaxID=3077944 RepID=UPI00313DB2CC
MAEDKTKDSKKILKLKFEAPKKELNSEKSMEKDEKKHPSDINKSIVDKKIEELNNPNTKLIKGMPQVLTDANTKIITNRSLNKNDNSSSFRKKTFIPKNENKFNKPKNEDRQNFIKRDFNNFNRNNFNNNFQNPSNSGFFKRDFSSPGFNRDNKDQFKSGFIKKDFPRTEGGFNNRNNTGAQNRFGQNNNFSGQPFNNRNNTGSQNRFAQNNNLSGQPFNNRNNTGSQNRFGQNNNLSGQPFNNRNNTGTQNRFAQNNKFGGQPFNNRNNTGSQNKFGQNNNFSGQPFNNTNKFAGQNNFDSKFSKPAVFFSSSPFEKKKRNGKKESSKPKLTQFSNIIGNNFIGRIEDSTLEDSVYYKVKKGRKNNFSKSKAVLKKTIELENEISLKELASLLSTKIEEIEYQLKYIGYDETININAPLSNEILEMVATSLGHKVIRKDSINQEKFDVFSIKIDENTAKKRAPIVAIVGHVDHGKTSLLDKIRKSNLTKSEVGGITQKIAAYSVHTKNGDITFIDTPGHSAFSNMRKRGINLNDITILVISSVEGVKDQTIEAIKQIQKTKTQLIVASTKCDLPGSNIEKIKQELSKHDVLVKDYGGDIELIEVSSVTGHNVELLLQTILVYADLIDLKANYDAKAIGVVLESKIDIKIGTLSTILIQQGTLKIGDVCSTLKTFGKVKGMWNDMHKSIKEATPGMAVEVLGLNDCPIPGDNFAVLDHTFATELTKKSVSQESISSINEIEDFFATEKPTLYLILNADTQGALEALEHTLNNLDVEHSKYKIVKRSVGKIKESDMDLAKLTNSMILNYNLSISKDIEFLAKNDNILICSSKIIYEIEKKVQEELEKMITLIEEELYTGTAVVKRIFKSSKIGNISGCMVIDGKILKGAVAIVLRKGKEVFKGKIESLKKSKDEVKEVANGLECGIFVNYKEISEEDEIKCYKIEYKRPT